MLFKDFYKVIIKNILLGVLAIAGTGFTNASASAEFHKVKIINKSDVKLAIALVRTKSGSNYVKHTELYGEYSKIKIFILAPGKDKSLTNFLRNSDEYDRVLWVVPLKLGDNVVNNLADFASALIAKNRSSYPSVKAFEVGSAKEISIEGTTKNLKSTTKGKWLEGFKSAAKSAFGEASATLPEPKAEVDGFSVSDLQVKEKIKKGWNKLGLKLSELFGGQEVEEDEEERARLERNREQEARLAKSKAGQKDIAKKYGR